jgi:arylsulfatase A-like enzyme
MNVDVAATVLELAGVPPGSPLHGRPLGSKPARDSVLIEYFSDTVFPRVRNMGYSAIRTQRWKYIRYRELKGADELYDLKSDPFELRNRIGDNGTPLPALRKQLDQLLAESGGARSG